MTTPEATALPLSEPTIDLNGSYPLRLGEDEQHRPVLELDLSRSTRAQFRHHLRELCWLEVNGKRIPAQNDPKDIDLHPILRFPLPEGGVEGATLTLGIHKEPIAKVKAEQGKLVPTAEHSICQLAVSETRALGLPLHSELSKIPYPRAARVGFDMNVHSPITELHTHSSAQIRADDLLAVALEADKKGPPVGYPVDLLKLLHVEEPNQKTFRAKSFEFTPLKDEDGLHCEQGGNTECDYVRIGDLTPRQREAIAIKMRIPPDGTMLFSDFDREMYRYRNPLVKNPALTKEMIKKIAEDYAAQGVQYAELSTGSMMNPKWFRAMAEAIDEIERDGVGPEHKKVTLRFLVNLPRNVGPQETLIALKKAQFLARHPYITGMDLTGYESNKTSDFHWALAHAAQWARASEGSDLDPKDGWDFKRDFTIRVHAGETGKNPENVSEAIKIAHKYGVRVRAAHALKADMDADTKQELKQLVGENIRDGLASDFFAFEMCPDSNQVYMTNTLVHKSPIKQRINQAPLFLGTDGGGAIATDARQLAYSAIAGGLTLEQLAGMRKHEEGFIERQRQREVGYENAGNHIRGKREAFTKRYGKDGQGLDVFLKDYDATMAKIPDAKASAKALVDYLPESYRGKVPVLIAGASGSSESSSWQEMSEAEHEHVRRSMQMLVRTLDPKKVYFVLGRVQKEGVSKALDYAVREHNMKNPTNKFDMLGRYAGAEQYPTGELAESISWVQNIPGGREGVPSSMLNFVKKHHGMALFFGGSDFTAEMAKGAALFKDIPHAAMIPEKGTMNLTSDILPVAAQFRSFEEFIDKILTKSGIGLLFRDEGQRKELVRADVDLEQAKEEAIAAAKLTKSQKVKKDREII